MRVHEYISSRREEHPLHFTLLDPGKTSAEDLITLAKQTADAGTDGFMVGGSTDLSLENVDLAVDTIKKTQMCLFVNLFQNIPQALPRPGRGIVLNICLKK